jgi:phosphoribosylamine-glycine ligase
MRFLIDYNCRYEDPETYAGMFSHRKSEYATKNRLPRNIIMNK